jgi:hypothetical protein
MSNNMGTPVRAHLARSRAQLGSYGVPTEEYAGPAGGGASLQTGNRQSTAFVFQSKQLREGASSPLAYSLDSSTSLLGARNGSAMGSNPLHPAGE